MSLHSKPRNCQTCHGGSKSSEKTQYPPLIVQCNSPLTHPPNCQVDAGQVLLAIETGRFYYWGKKLFDDDNDGNADRCEHTWLDVKCGECAPISYRQSQIFFKDNFTGVEVVRGPERDVDYGGNFPQPGDYLIDSINHTLWRFHMDCTWQMETATFGGAIINDDETSLTEVWSSAKIAAELAAVGGDIEDLDASAIKSGQFADARISASSVVQHAGSIPHQSLIGAGLNTHSQIDTHIANQTIHRSINDASLTAVDLWSAQKISGQLALKSGISHVHDASDVTSGVFNNARISQTNVTQHVGALQHQLLAGAGAKNHTQIDAHIDDVTIHRSINDNGTLATDLWSAAHLITELSNKSNTNHTHVAANISDFSGAVDTRISMQKGVANGIATLDANGKVPAWQLELDSVVYQGTWNATTNSPTLLGGVGTKGHYYVVSVAGSTLIDTINDWQTGDWIIFSGTAWEKADHTDQVTSVAGKQGSVTLVAADVTDFDAEVANNTTVVANTAHASNTSNPHNVTKAQIGLGFVQNIKVKLDASNAPTQNDDESSGYSIGSQWCDIVANRSYVCVDATAGAAIWRHSDIESHTDLLDIGVNTHEQIDAHIDDDTIHRVINDNGVSTTDLWSASKITTSLATKANNSHTHAASDVTSGIFADARIAQSNVTQHVGALIHQSLSGAGTNTHAQIDSHITDATRHRVINDSGTSTTELWSASKINTELSGKANTIHTHAASEVTSGTFADARIAQSSVTQHNSALIHQSLVGAGTNTHTQIDSHIADVTKHRIINDTGTSATELWSASKVFTQLALKSNVGHSHTASDVTDFNSAVSTNTDVAAATFHIANTSNPHSVTKQQVGLGNVPNLKEKLDATVAPTANDDSSQGYAIGSLWINVTAQRVYVCTSAAVGAANWRLLDITDHADLANVGINTHTQIDTHIDDNTKHRQINDAATTIINLWSATKIAAELATKAEVVHVHDAEDITSGEFANERISQSSVTQYVGALNHQSLNGAGVKTHAEIDLHIADATIHREINDNSSSSTETWSSLKTATELNGKAALSHVHDADDITTGVFANARIAASNVTQHNSALQHQSLTGAGTNTHAQIDSHISNALKHRQINDTGSSNTDLWSASQIISQLAEKSPSNHTHVATDVVDFNTVVDGRITVQKGAANGLATLDATGKVPASQLQLDSISYQGTWNANTNNPTLANSVGTKGFYYVVSVSGTTSINGQNDWQVGDWIIFNGVVWEKADHTDQVTSVAGKQGAITLVSTDVTDFQSAVTANTDVVASTSHRSNTSNPHNVTKAQVGLGNVENLKVKLNATTAPNVIDDASAGFSAGSLWIDTVAHRYYICINATTGAAIWKQAGVESHTELLDIGTHTHPQIDTHINDASIHRQINDSASGTTDLWSADKISTLLGGKAATVHTHAASDVTSGTFADARISASNVTQHVGSLVHQSLSGAGINTHAQIDTHIGDATKHRQINDSGTATTDLWSASKIASELGGKAAVSHTHDTDAIISGTFADARISVSNVTQHVGSLLHQSLSGAGSNTHAQIDSHIADATIHRQINDSATTATNLWSASKIATDLAGKSDTTHTHVAANITDFTSAVAATASVSANTAHRNDVTTNPHNVTKGQVGLGNVQNTKVNLVAIVPPTANDDSSLGYSVGSTWMDTVGASWYICMSAAATAAVWRRLDIINHTELSNIGTNTHAQIDTHIADATIHRQINDSTTTTTNLWSASKVSTDLSGKAATSHVHAASDVTSGTFANARIAASNVTQHVGSLIHQSLSGAGSNTHAQIDTHIADATIHRQINDAGTSTIETWSASKVNSQLAAKAALSHTHAASDVTSGTFADARIAASNVTQHVGSLIHQSLSGAGTNTHAQIDTHIADATKHRQINDAGTATTDLWSASKINTQLGGKAATSHTHVASDITSGTFADAQIAQSNVTQHNAALSHQLMLGAGSNTHAQIDSHIADATKHRQINDVGSAATDLWSASKIITQLGTKSDTSHTHTASNITDFNSAADARITLQKGVANGIASLDSAGKVPASQLSLDNVSYQGSWNANTNTPTLVSSVGTKGYYYVVSVAGTTSINGITDWQPSDWIIFNGTVWEKADHSASVTSVAGKQGAVTLVATDITNFDTAVTNNANVAAATTHLANTSNPHSVTKAQVGLGNVQNVKVNLAASSAPTVTDDSNAGYTVGSIWINTTADRAYVTVDATAGSAIWRQIGIENHADLANIGTNTHAQIDTHIADATKHRQINDAGVATTDLWSASKITTQLATKAATLHTHATSDITSGTFVDARIAQSNVTQYVGALVHQSLSGAGSNTHSQIDTHIANTTIHRQINDAATTTTNLWSASKISTDLAGKSAVGHVHATSDITSGTFADARIAQSNVTQYNAVLVHQSLSGAGTNTHTQIDTHIADATKHRQINDVGTTTTDLWSASQIITQLATKAASSHTHAASDVTSGTFVDARIAQSNVTQYNASLVHQTLSGAGTNTHAQIDTHIADATKHRQINDAGSASTDLWSASQIISQIAVKAATVHTHAASDITSGTFVDARIASSNVTQHNSALVHQTLSGAGTNTHAQIDAHLADTTTHITSDTQTFSGDKTFATLTASTYTSGNIKINGDTGISFINCTQVAATNSSSIVVSVPSGTIRDNLLLCHICIRSASSDTIIGTSPAGWQLLRSTSFNNSGIYQYYYVFAKYAVTTEASTYTWSSISPTNNSIVSIMCTYSGVAAFDVFNAEQNQTTASSLTHVTPSVTTTVENTMLVAVFMYASSTNSWSGLTSGLTQCATINSVGSASISGETLMIARKLQVAVGATGTFSATAANDADFGITELIALTPISNGNNILLTNVAVLDIAPVNASKINLGNQNAPTCAYNLSTTAAYPTDSALNVVSAKGQTEDIVQIWSATPTIRSGFNSSAQLFLNNSTTSGFRTTILAATPTANRTWTIQNATDTFVGRQTEDTLRNKSFADGTSCAFIDLSDESNKLYFNINGTGGHEVQIYTEATGHHDEKIYIPDTDGETERFVLEGLEQTLKNKTLTQPTISSIKNSGTITLPTGTHTLVARDTTDTLTNKTLTGTTNTIRATHLATADADVVISASSAPTVGQVLVANTATTASWQNQTSTTAGSTTQVQYNNAGVMAGSSNLTIDTDEYVVLGEKSYDAPAAPSSGVKLFARSRAGRKTLAQIGSNGVDYSMQPYLFAQKISLWTAQGNGTLVSTINFGITNTGSLTTRNIATTNMFTSMRRLGFVSSTSAGSSAGTRHALQQFFRGNGTAGVGGFFYVVRFGISSVATVATQRAFVGLYASTLVIGNVDPSSLTNILGFAFNAADSSWTFMHNDASGTATKDTLTGTFPARTLSVNMMEARIFCPSNDSIVHYSLEVMDGGSLYEGSATTDLPASTTLLSPQIWTNNGTTAQAVGIDVVSQYVETDF